MPRISTGEQAPSIPADIPADITFADFCSLYLADVCPRLKPASAATKERILRDKILPFFGPLPMARITTQHVRRWQSVILRQNYSRAYCQLIDFQLGALMNYAARFCGFPDPCRKAGHIGGRRAKKPDFWTPEEYGRFIACLSGDPEAFTAFELLYWTGMRQGELLALTPEDIDGRRRRISVTKTYTQIDGEDIISEPKTKKSLRDISIPQFLLDEVDVYIRTGGIRPGHRLFERTHHYLLYKLKKGCADSGVRRIRIHDLRHSHVSLLINAGFSPLDIAERVGHESVSTTLDVYAHLFPDQQKLLTDRLEELHRACPEAPGTADGGAAQADAQTGRSANTHAGTQTDALSNADAGTQTNAPANIHAGTQDARTR